MQLSGNFFLERMNIPLQPTNYMCHHFLLRHAISIQNAKELVPYNDMTKCFFGPLRWHPYYVKNLYQKITNLHKINSTSHITLAIHRPLRWHPYYVKKLYQKNVKTSFSLCFFIKTVHKFT
ncbi:hypothetical protein ACJX0J_013627 [Zea mays]